MLILIFDFYSVDPLGTKWVQKKQNQMDEKEQSKQNDTIQGEI